jgi:two-component sensor histidine kinase
MSRDITAIGEGRDPSARLSEAGSDELSEVAKAINGMLGELDESQRQIKASLAEKELLLKEIHHRIKNNLQFVSSLLYLQSRTAQSVASQEEIQSIFMESQSRIKAMSFVHEELYQSDDLARINLADYVNTLADHLTQLYGSRVDPVRITTETENVFLGIDAAVPCGLILNELLTNSMKHAFPNGKQGEIRVELRQVESTEIKEVLLAVNDNGVGFQQGFDPRNMQSLGLQLVVTLVEQLGGSMEFNGSDGARVEVSFNLAEM